MEEKEVEVLHSHVAPPRSHVILRVRDEVWKLQRIPGGERFLRTPFHTKHADLEDDAERVAEEALRHSCVHKLQSAVTPSRF